MEVMCIPKLSDEKLEYIEEVGLMLDAFGLPRMAGRVLGVLLVADPPEQTAEDLATVLQASRGSISSSTRMLEHMGIIDRVSKPGERRDYFRNKPDAWHESTRQRMAAIGNFRKLAEKGLTILDSDDPEVRRGLVELRDYCVFWEQELPIALNRWDAMKDEEAAPIPERTP